MLLLYIISCIQAQPHDAKPIYINDEEPLNSHSDDVVVEVATDIVSSPDSTLPDDSGGIADTNESTTEYYYDAAAYIPILLIVTAIIVICLMLAILSCW